MKQHLQRLRKFFFLSALMLLMSCQNDESAPHSHQHDSTTGRITLKQFKEETKISDFSSVFRTASIAGIEGKGTESIDDFVIDTLAVEKYNSDHSGVSYSFFVYPINREEVGLNEIFNLVYYKDGNKWETSIFSLEKISTPGNPDSYENIQMLYGRLQNNAGICWSMNYSFHCTGTGPCAGGRCDMCSLCVSTSSTANVCSSGAGSSQLPTDSVSPDFGVSTGGGGGVSYAQLMNALRLDADHVAWIENDQNSFFKARLLEMGIGLPSIAAVAEIREEFKNKVDFLIRHPQMCQDIMIYVIANNYFVSAQIFGWEMVNAGMNGTAISFLPFFKYPVGSNYATLYPNLTEYLKNKLPLLKNNRFVINKLIQYSQLSENQIRKDLTWGAGPTIVIAQLDNYCDSCDSETYGIFKSTEPNTLYIDIDFVNLLENSSSGPEGNSLAFLLGVTILHEYVHLGDNTDGQDQPGEEGLQFEEATYGESIWLNNAGDVLIKWQQ